MSRYECPRCRTPLNPPDSKCPQCRWSPHLVHVPDPVVPEPSGEPSRWPRRSLVLSLIGLFAGLHLLGAAWLDIFVFNAKVFCDPALLTAVIVFGLPPYCFLAMTLSAWSLFRNRDTRSAMALLAGFDALALALFDIVAIVFMGVMRGAVSV